MFDYGRYPKSMVTKAKTASKPRATKAGSRKSTAKSAKGTKKGSSVRSAAGKQLVIVESPAALLTEGAKLVSNVTDILEELNLTAVARQVPLPLPVDMDGDPESALLGLLNDDPQHIDDIRRRADVPISSVSSMLTMLELKGLVRQVGCMHYVRLREVSQVYGN